MDIIQYAAAKADIDDHSAADKAFMMQNFSKGRGIKLVCLTGAEFLV